MAFLARSDLSAAATLALTDELLAWQSSDVGKTVTLSRLLSELGIFRVIAASAAGLSLTGTTAETAIATITIPAGALGANGILRINIMTSVTNSANNKTVRIRLGGIAGTVYFSTVVTTNFSGHFLTLIRNRNSVSSQVGWIAGTTAPYGVNNAALPTSALNTAVAQDLVITGQLANSGETITVEAYQVELLSKA